MTIVVGFSASRQSTASLNLAAQIALNSGEPLIAAVIIERAWPPRDDPVERDYLRLLTEHTEQALHRVVDTLPGGADIPVVVRQSSSIPAGLTELADEHRASLVVVGSSSSGLLGRVALGSVTDRLVHTAALPVAIAPRAYPLAPGRLTRITAAYGGDADLTGLLGATAQLAEHWSVPVRIVSFTVRPTATFGGLVTSGPEDLVVEQWRERTRTEVAAQLEAVRKTIALPDVELVVGTGLDWREAVENVPWQPGDILALGSGAAGQAARVFLGSAASKILRHSPVPVLIAPRRD